MSTTPDLTHARWTASSYSGNGGAHCLIVAPDIATATGTVPVRDSKSPDAGTLLVPHAQWARFVRHLTARATRNRLGAPVTDRGSRVCSPANRPATTGRKPRR